MDSIEHFYTLDTRGRDMKEDGGEKNNMRGELGLDFRRNEYKKLRGYILYSMISKRVYEDCNTDLCLSATFLLKQQHKKTTSNNIRTIRTARMIVATSKA